MWDYQIHRTMRDMPLLIGVEGRYPQEDPATKGHCEVNGEHLY